MALRRMLHKNISYSKQVNSLSEFQQLLFTWTIPHLDDFGRIDGDPQTLKAMVMPLSKRDVNEFEEAILKMVEVALIDRYQIKDELVIQYINFERYQTGLEKRTKSKYPEKEGLYDNSQSFQEVQRNSSLTEENRIEPNLISANLNESNNFVADSSKEVAEIDPYDFQPTSAEETAAIEIWNKIEPNNKRAFTTTYLWAARQGLPADLFYSFYSEIRDSKTVRNQGAVFRTKALEYIRKNLAKKFD